MIEISRPVVDAATKHMHWKPSGKVYIEDVKNILKQHEEIQQYESTKRKYSSILYDIFHGRSVVSYYSKGGLFQLNLTSYTCCNTH